MLNGSKKEIPIEGHTHDILSAFYWFRLQEVSVGDTVITGVNSDEKNWLLNVNVLRTERLEIRNLGTFDAFVIEPLAHFKGVLVDRGKAWIYISADSRRIPLMIRLKTPFGPVVGILRGIADTRKESRPSEHHT